MYTMNIKKEYKLGWLAFWLLVLDQLTKYLFFDKAYLADWPVFHPAFNTGVSWSVQIPIVIVILIAGLALWAFVVAYQRKYFNWLVLALLLAGTLWNLLDRVALQWVRDFISVWSRFPIFNFADIYLNVGVILFLLAEFFAWKVKAKS